jgi:hypothetical protein
VKTTRAVWPARICDGSPQVIEVLKLMKPVLHWAKKALPVVLFSV